MKEPESASEMYVLNSIKELKAEVKQLDKFIREHMLREEDQVNAINNSIRDIQIQLKELEIQRINEAQKWNWIWRFIIPVAVGLTTATALIVLKGAL